MSLRFLLDFAIQILYKIDKSGRWHYPILLLGSIACLLLYAWTNQTDRIGVSCEIAEGEFRPIMASTLVINDLWSAKFTTWGSRFVDTSNLVVAWKNCDEIVAFELKTGRIVWTTEKIESGDLTPDETRNRLYIASPRGIHALSLSDGGTLWFQDASPLWGRGYQPVRVLDDGRVTVQISSIWEINPDTGSLRPISFPMPNYTTLTCGDIAYTAETGVIRAIKRSTNEILWSTQTGERIPLTGAVNFCGDDRLLLVRWGALSTWLTALDRQTGKILWDIKDHIIVSNVVVADGIVYVLDAEARLLMLDAQSGVELGTIQFKPPKKTELLYEPGAIGVSWLGVSGSAIAIYFNDTSSLAVMTQHGR